MRASSCEFQSTLPRGERLLFPGGCRIRLVVSIHAPARGATWTVEFTGTYAGKFQSTLPRGERLQPSDENDSKGGFNPRSRAGSDGRPRGRRHVLVRVSIHAPARGATTSSPRSANCFCCFNPRSRAGSDEGVFDLLWADPPVSIHAPARGATTTNRHSIATHSVSIHAPARGATTPCSESPVPRTRFNPRSRAGSDLKLGVKPVVTERFQSTLPRGERLKPTFSSL